MTHRRTIVEGDIKNFLAREFIMLTEDYWTDGYQNAVRNIHGPIDIDIYDDIVTRIQLMTSQQFEEWNRVDD